LAWKVREGKFDVKILYQPSIVAMVISIVMVIVGAISILSLPIAQFPDIAPPEIQILQPTSVRTHKPRTGGGHSHRAAGERRGQYELHVFAERHRQFEHDRDCEFRRKNRSQHGF